MEDSKKDAASCNYFTQKETGHMCHAHSGHCYKHLSELTVLPLQIPRVLGSVACWLSELGQGCHGHQLLPVRLLHQSFLRMTRMGFSVSNAHGIDGFAWLPERRLWCTLITSSIDTKTSWV